MEQVQSIAQENNRFALDLYETLREQPGNLFFSPFSISTALAMAYAGARGSTAEEMAKALRFSADTSLLHEGFGDLLNRLTPDEGEAPYTLNIANRLWGQEGFGFEPEYLDLTRTRYGSELAQVDFKANPEGVRQEINGWIAEMTKDKIKDLLPQGSLDALTRLVLTNAIYFKGDWALQFDPDRTRDEPFWVTADQSIPTPMMIQKEDFLYAKSGDVSVLELPYEGEALSMFLVLPDSIDGLDKVEQSLSADSLLAWREKMTPGDVDVRLPRFEMRSRFGLNGALSGLGMPTAFTDRADFSGMAETGDLFINSVFHEAYVKVNEEGTEAAAATGMVMALSSMPEEPRQFHADHPFLFLIRDNATGSILFLGRMADPTV